MSKLILTGLFTATALALASCGGGAENNMAVENFEDMNATEDVNMDMNATDMNMGMDMNATDMNATENATDNATDSGNAATNNSTGY